MMICRPSQQRRRQCQNSGYLPVIALCGESYSDDHGNLDDDDEDDYDDDHDDDNYDYEQDDDGDGDITTVAICRSLHCAGNRKVMMIITIK